MFPICISFTEIAFLEARANMRSLASQNFYVQYVQFLIEKFSWWQIFKYTFFLIPANTGGLLGLFMGFSVFSIIEIFYFLTFRPCIQHMKEPKKRHQPMKRRARRYPTNRGRISKTLLRPRIRFELPQNNSVFPYVD